MPKADLARWAFFNTFSHVEAAYLAFELEPDGGYVFPSNDAPGYVKRLATELREYAWRLYREGSDAGFSDEAIRKYKNAESYLVALTDSDIEFKRADLLNFFETVKGRNKTNMPAFLRETAPTGDGKEAVGGTPQADSAQSIGRKGSCEVVSEGTYLGIIKAMKHLMLEATNDRDKPMCEIETQNKLIEILNDRYSAQIKGLSTRTLSTVFSAANKLGT